MTQTSLIERFKTVTENDEIDYSTASRHFKSLIRFNSETQQGVASSQNFFDSTVALFRETEKPEREPDFQSDSGSCYWYSEEGVVRGSDHWGNCVANCDWALALNSGRTEYGTSSWGTRKFREPKYGFARWQDFELKSKLYNIDNQEVLTIFDNTIGRDTVIVNGKKYKKVVTVSWQEA